MNSTIEERNHFIDVWLNFIETNWQPKNVIFVCVTG